MLYTGFFLTVAATQCFAQSQPTDQAIVMSHFHNDDISSLISYGNCQWLYPLDEPNETLTARAECHSATPFYYALKLGDAEDNIHTIIMDESQGTGAGYDTMP